MQKVHKVSQVPSFFSEDQVHTHMILSSRKRVIHVNNIYSLCLWVQEGITSVFGGQENGVQETDTMVPHTFCHQAARIWHVASEKIGELTPTLQAIPEFLGNTYSHVTEHGPEIIHFIQNVWNKVFTTQYSSTIGLIAVSAATFYIANRIRSGIRSVAIFTLGVASGAAGVYLLTTNTSNAPTSTS
jgi:hypothetical protein